MATKKVALVCDWLTNVGGAERVLLSIHEMYPNAPIYTSKYDKKGIDWFKNADVRTGWLQIFPTKLRRFLSPLRQHYFSHLDLTEYDLVISVTGAEAKAVRTKPKNPNKTGKNRTENHKTEHVCYCHVPTQYYWQMYDDYIKNPGFGILNPLARLGLKIFVKPLRKKDYNSAQNPDKFVTISKYAADQIKKYYDRESTIIHPPVNTKKFSTTDLDFSTRQETKNEKSQAQKKHKTRKSQEQTEVEFITTSRQVTWKRLDLCIEACLKTNSHLTIIGEGPEHNNLVRLAGGSPLISFYPQMAQNKLKNYLRNAEGYLFPSMEPFGIAPVEALAAGCPVIAFGKGGAVDYIKPNTNGIFFEAQTVDSLVYAIKKFKDLKFNRKKVEKSAEPFDEKIFEEKLKKFIEKSCEA